MDLLSGKVVILSGGNSGIGKSISQRLRSLGARVAVLSRSARSEPDTPDFLYYRCDVTSNDECRAAVADAVARLGPPDGLACNAGITELGDITTISDEQIERVFAVNVMSTVRLCRLVLPHMVAGKKGSIVLTTSVAGLRGCSRQAAYVMSKHAEQGLMKTIAVDYGKYNVRANCVAPGWTRTPMSEMEMAELAESRGTSKEEAFEFSTRYYPLKRMSETSEVADAICYLLSDLSSAITGATLPVDAGSMAVDVGAPD